MEHERGYDGVGPVLDEEGHLGGVELGGLLLEVAVVGEGD